MSDPLAINFDTAVYPYATGYAQLSDVQSRINAGTWDASKPNAHPTVAQVNAWLLDATGQVDAALLRAGYTVPLAPRVGFVAPAGMPTWRGIGVQVWLYLRNVVADYVAAMVQATRHSGSRAEDQDSQAWQRRFASALDGIRNGRANLAQLGADGGFPPTADPAQGVDTGTDIDEPTLMDPNALEEPVFGRHNTF